MTDTRDDSPIPGAPPARDDAERLAEQIAGRIEQDICELPDRNSPDDWPEAMLVTGEELRIIVLRALDDFRDASLAAANAMRDTWKREHDIVVQQRDAARAEIATLKAEDEIKAKLIEELWDRYMPKNKSDVPGHGLRSAAPSGDLRAKSIDDIDYQTLFFAIGAAVETAPGTSITISVKAFRDALASPQPDELQACSECPDPSMCRWDGSFCHERRCAMSELEQNRPPQPDAGARGEAPIYTGEKPTIHELEDILERQGQDAIAINPDGSITTVPASSPSPEAAPPSADDVYDCNKRAALRFYSMQAWGDGHVQDKIDELERELRAARQAGVREGREQMREEAAQVAEQDQPLSECPYGNDKPGDPTWNHTDKEKCPRCGQTGFDDGSKCLGHARHRIAARIRALAPDPKEKRDE